MPLPEFIIETVDVDGASGSYTMLCVTCPRKECKGEFWVRTIWAYLAPSMGEDGQVAFWFTGRSCPYCCKTAAIPAEYARKRRVVRRTKSVHK